MNFREELLKAKDNYKMPESIQKLLDSGIIQGVETIDGINYINFAFYLNEVNVYNYKKQKFASDFWRCECIDVIYVGGMAVDNQYNILKGVIYPFYTKMHTKDEFEIFGKNMSFLPYIQGTPQLIDKTDNLKLNNFFHTNDSFTVFNISTDFSDVWSEFAAGKESYKNTSIIKSRYGFNIAPIPGYNDITYFGTVFSEENFEIVGVNKYYGSTLTHGSAIPISFVEKELKHESVLSSIATKIYCNDSYNKSRIKAAEIQKEGMNNIAKSIITASYNIRQGESNIANALNQHADVVYYQ